MHTIKHIKQFPTLDSGLKSLSEEFGIKVKQYDDLIVLNYCQIDSPKSSDVAIECRGLIIDKMCNVVSRSFDRFFNYGEMPDYYTDFSWSDSIVYEKADGSLIKVYWNPYGKQWEISTRGSAFAEVDHAAGGTFREWVLKAFGVTEEEFQTAFTHLDNNFTYIFEYTAPENRIVTRYIESQMVILAVRDNITFEEVVLGTLTSRDIMVAAGLNVRHPEMYDVQEPADIVRMSEELPVLEEGYVVLDTVSGKRIKIKNPGYVTIHHMRGNGAPTPKNITSLVVRGEDEEYLSYYPEEEELFKQYQDAYVKLQASMNGVYEDAKGIQVQKEFALKVKDTPFSAIMFQARAKDISVAQSFKDSRLEYRINLVLEVVSLSN